MKKHSKITTEKQSPKAKKKTRKSKKKTKTTKKKAQSKNTVASLEEIQPEQIKSTVSLLDAKAPASSQQQQGSGDIQLSNIKRHWFFGEWEKISSLHKNNIQNHPERARLSLFIASAHQQLADHEKTRKYSRLALEWGCPQKSVAQVLIAGVHNTLGKISALDQDERRTANHFNKAISVVSNNNETELSSHARSVHEMTRLGLLPEALSQTKGLSQYPQYYKHRPKYINAHTKVIDMEIDWLRERVLSLQKQQYSKKKKDILGDIEIPTKKDTNLDLDQKKYYGLNKLDKKLEAYIDYDDGYFVELGANDGIAQSNTIYFEKERNWRGLLIEPILHNFFKCKTNRSSDNSFVCAACVSFEHDKPHVTLYYSDLMTAPSELESDIDNSVDHALSGRIYLKENEDVVEVFAVARTLTSILDEVYSPHTIDLLSLDVEGAEIEVLKGIDHNKYRFKYMLIECRNEEQLVANLEKHGYVLVDKISHHDYLFCDKQMMLDNV